MMVDEELSDISVSGRATSNTGGGAPSALEVTHEQYVRHARQANATTPTRRRTDHGTISSNSKTPGRAGGGGNSVLRLKCMLGVRQPGDHNKKLDHGDSSVGELASVASESRSLISNPMTVGSLETTKASNKTEKVEESATGAAQPTTKKEKTPWSKLKRIIGVKSAVASAEGTSVSSVDGVAPSLGNRQRSRTEDSANSDNPFRVRGRRSRSSPDQTSSVSEHLSRLHQQMSDDGIRGRFDGIDTWHLGDVHLPPPLSAAGVTSTDELPPWDRPWECTFTGKTIQWTPGEIVTNSLWASSGQDPPEIILDSFCPGPNGRWSVRILKQTDDSLVNLKPPADSPPPPLQRDRSPDSASENSSPIVALRRMFWGDPDPSRSISQLNLDGTSHSDNDDPMHDLATRCSIPIDIDDDTFIITTREHIHSLHDAASVSLVRGNFQDALRIFTALLKGLGSAKDPDLRFTKGATLHNMGLLELWMGQPNKAVSTLSKALEERLKQCPPKHPDIAVTLSRKAAACFAVGKYEEAIAALQHALEISPTDQRCRAKLLTSLGVVYHCQKDYGGALREFTMALEIQRQWLDNPVRRETTVYDAAVTLNNMCTVYLATSDNELAVKMSEEALMLATTIFRMNHDFVLSTLRSLSVTKAQIGQYGNALLILQGCLRSQSSRFGVLSAESMETVGLSAYMYARNDDFDDALKCLLTVRQWQRVNLPENHTALLKSKICQKALEARTGKNVSGFGVTKVWI